MGRAQRCRPSLERETPGPREAGLRRPMRASRRNRTAPLASASAWPGGKVEDNGPHAALAAELTALPALSRDVLKARWKELYGATPPSHLGRPILIRAIAYRIQEQVFGGLDAATRRLLDRAAQDLANGREPSPSAAIQPGTRLLREWQGVVHEVLVHEHGVEYRGKTWSSVWAVARDITGTRWSGPLFFGLKGRKRDGG